MSEINLGKHDHSDASEGGESISPDDLSGTVVWDGSETLSEAVNRLPSDGGQVLIPQAGASVTAGTNPVIDRPTVVRGAGQYNTTIDGNVTVSYQVDLPFDGGATETQQWFSGLENLRVDSDTGGFGLKFDGETQLSAWTYLQNVLVTGSGGGILGRGIVFNHSYHNVLVHSVDGKGWVMDGGSTTGRLSNIDFSGCRVREADGIGVDFRNISGVDFDLSINQNGADANGVSARFQNIIGLNWRNGNVEKNDGATLINGVDQIELGGLVFRANGQSTGVTSSGGNTVGNILLDQFGSDGTPTRHANVLGIDAHDAATGDDLCYGQGLNTGAVRELAGPTSASTAPGKQIRREIDTVRIQDFVPESKVFRPTQYQWRFDNTLTGGVPAIQHKDTGGTVRNVIQFNKNTGEMTIVRPNSTGSSTDPRQDTTADDWMVVEKNGTTYYTPLYQ
jgi:hypothetical protein